MQIYQKEIDAGIADLVEKNTSFSYTAVAKRADFSDEQKSFARNIAFKSSGRANPEQLDLFYLESVLVSVGWNKNDDVFDPQEVWRARHTPVDKQFNYMHNEKDIIGHLTSSIAVDFEGNLIDENIELSDLPDKYDIVVGSVLYKSWEDSELQQRMIDIIDGIGKGAWFVSMECLFPNFDYAIVTPDGQNKIIARNDETSFLTRYLRVYGGEGVFNGYKIGRLLRDLTYSGKGLVDNPANPRSIITTFHSKHEVSSFSAAAALDKFDTNKEFNHMSEVTYTQAQYDAIKKELDELKAKSQAEFESQLEVLQKEKSDLEAQIGELKQNIESLKTEANATQEVLTAKDEKISGLEEKVTSIMAKLDEAEAKIADAEAKAVNSARRSLLLEKVDEEKADKLVEKFASASDELFQTLVDSLPAKKMEDEDWEKKKKKEKEKKSEAEDTSEEEEELDTAEANEDELDMAGDSEDQDEVIRTKASEWFSNLMTSTKKGDK